MDLGRDYFLADDWENFHGIKLTDEQRDLMPAIPWDDDLLASPCPWNKDRRIGETHYGFLGLPSIKLEGDGEELMNMMRLQKLYPADRQPRFASYAPDSWYKEQDFANLISLGFRYHLLLREIVPKSESKHFFKQEKMLPAEYEVPSAVAETAKDLFIHKMTKVFVNPNRWARTSDLDSFGGRVVVGYCGARGVIVNDWHGGVPDGYIGVGASRKFEQKLVA